MFNCDNVILLIQFDCEFVEDLPHNWGAAPDIHWFHSLDRSFVFPGTIFF